MAHLENFQRRDLFKVPSIGGGHINIGSILLYQKETHADKDDVVCRYSVRDIDLQYMLKVNDISNTIISGCSRTGKTVLAMKLAKEFLNIKDRLKESTNQKLRIVCIDPKSDWRKLKEKVNPQAVTVHTLGDVKLNPWKTPNNTSPSDWACSVIDIFCRSTGLLELGRDMLLDAILPLYERTNNDVDFVKIYKRLDELKEANPEKQDAYDKLLSRIEPFADTMSTANIALGTSEGLGVDELISDDGIIIFETDTLDNTVKKFVSSVIATGFHNIATKNVEVLYKNILILEDADKTSFSTPFLDEWAINSGLDIVFIARDISDLPKRIVDNCELIFIGRQTKIDNMDIVIRELSDDISEQAGLFKAIAGFPPSWFATYSKNNSGRLSTLIRVDKD